MSLLFNLSRRWAWPAVEFRCQSHPHEADARDDKGDTALHWAVFGNPPVETVEALLTACPDLASVANNEGLIPLHLAASYRASGSVIRALVEAHPAGPGIPVPRSGSSALHLMCDVGAPVEAFRAVVETDAGAGSLRKVDRIFRQKPLQILSARKTGYYSIISKLRELRQREDSLRREARISGADIEADLERFASQVEEIKVWDFWLKTSILIQAEYKGSALEPGEDATCRVVHACAAIPDCPTPLLELAALLYPDQLVEQDDEGQAPLHKAVAKPAGRVLYDVLCAEATRIRDHNGKYPLQIAIDTGRRRWGTGVGSLIAANPAAVECLDLDGRLYPLLWSKLSREESWRRGPEALFLSIQSKPDLFAVNRN